MLALMASANEPNPAPQDEYVGSETCQACHATESGSWEHSLHSRFLRSVREARSSGDAGWTRKDPPFDPSLGKYVLGNAYKLVFLTGLAKEDTFIPYQFDVASETWEPFTRSLWDYGVDTDTDGSWLTRCAGCHTTGFDPKTDTFAEWSVGCEACHGPGAKHSDTESKDDILNPATLVGAEGDYVCARCHSHGIDKTTGRPYPGSGTSVADVPASFAFSAPTTGKNDDVFWGNGFARRHHAQFNELRLSKHFGRDVRCFDCHDVHRYRHLPASKQTLLYAKTERYLSRRRTHGVCVRCHSDKEGEIITSQDGRTVDAHTMHPVVIDIPARTRPPTSERNPLKQRMRCGQCHMPAVNMQETGYQTRTHSFQIAHPEDTTKYGVPNSCNSCHSDKDPAWASEHISDWRDSRSGDAR